MTFAETLRLVFAPPHPAGRPFIYLGTFVFVIGILFARWLAVFGAAFLLFCLYFFRDPDRVPPPRDGVIVAPADGKVVSVRTAVPPDELALGTQPRWQVGIFLSVLDVHVNRVPAAGIVERIAYRRGAYINAAFDKASEDNERNAIAIRLPDGRSLAVVQIAGLIARRIVCSLREGDSVRTGERFGIIRFGSRTDVYLPDGVRPLVAEGQTMIGGETVLAQLDT